MAVAERLIEHEIDSKRFPYDPDFAAAIRPEEVCGPRHALPGAHNSFGGEIVTGDEAVDEGGAWRRMRTCKELLAWTCGELFDRVYSLVVKALWDRRIDPRKLGGAVDEAARDAVERVHNSDRLPGEAAEAVVRELLEGR